MKVNQRPEWWLAFLGLLWRKVLPFSSTCAAWKWPPPKIAQDAVPSSSSHRCAPPQGRRRPRAPDAPRPVQSLVDAVRKLGCSPAEITPDMSRRDRRPPARRATRRARLSSSQRRHQRGEPQQRQTAGRRRRACSRSLPCSRMYAPQLDGVLAPMPAGAQIISSDQPLSRSSWRGPSASGRLRCCWRCPDREAADELGPAARRCRWPARDLRAVWMPSVPGCSVPLRACCSARSSPALGGASRYFVVGGAVMNRTSRGVGGDGRELAPGVTVRRRRRRSSRSHASR